MNDNAGVEFKGSSTYARFDDNARCYFGTNSDAYIYHNNSDLYLSVNNNDRFFIVDQNSSNNPRIQFNTSDGSMVCEGNITAYGAVSDRRLKENISKIENASEIVDKLNGYRFNYIGKTDHMIGVMAQEVEDVAPELVYEQDGHKAMRYDNMTALLLEAIKEQRKEIEELKKVVYSNR